jgi:hypothetical protein
MAVPTSNVNVLTESFQNWIDKTNILLDAYSTTIVTSSSNTAGGLTTGNVNVEGIFRANTIAVSSQLRGGNVTSSGVLVISSNVSVGNSTVNTVINTTTLDTALKLVVGGSANLNSTLGVQGVTTLAGNAVLNGTFQSISGNSSFDAGVLFVDSVNNRVGINNTAPGVALKVAGDVEVSSNLTVQTDLKVLGLANLNSTVAIAGTLTVDNTTTLIGNVDVQGALHTISGNVNIDTGVLFVDSVNNRVGINNTTPSVALGITGDLDVSANAIIRGNSNVSGNLTLTGSLVSPGGQVNAVGNVAVSKDLVVTGNTLLTGNRLVINTTGISVNAVTTFTANTTLQRNVSVQGTSLSLNVASMQVASNSNLGSNTTSQLLILSVPKASFKGGELIVNATKLGQSQVSKLLFAHDDTNVEMTTYGTVMSPTSSPELITVLAGINNTNVEFSVIQTSTSTAVKMMATLF